MGENDARVRAMVAEADVQYVCYICLSSDFADSLPAAQNPAWVHPCRCRGETKWVHERCIRQWINELREQSESTTKPLYCAVCKAQYKLVYPPVDRVLLIFQKLNDALALTCPLVLASVLSSAFYFLCVTYGGITLMQVYGREWTLACVANVHPVALTLSLPSIPVCLGYAGMCPWEDAVVNLLRRRLLGEDCVESRTDHTINAKSLCFSLFLPVIACGVGSLLFGGRVRDPLKRALLGGAVAMGVKGICVIYYKFTSITYRNSYVISNYD